MRRLIHSFDVFDTLIARRSVEPRQILKKLEARSESRLSSIYASHQAADMAYLQSVLG